MKKFYSFLVMIFIACAFVLCGCGRTPLDMPATNDAVIGNGGIAVVKGDYLYYINGYDDASAYTDYKTENVYGKEVRGAIYRTTLVDGEIQKDKDGFLVETQVVVPKVVGFSTGGFYIIGDYLYYTTPLMELSYPEKKLQNDKMEICRIKLDGTGNERLATTKNANSTFNWGVYLVDGNTYVVFLDGKNLVSVKAENKEYVVMAEGVSSVALLKQDNFAFDKDALKDNEKLVYYARSVKDSDANQKAKNIFASVKIGTNAETILADDNNTTYEVKAMEAGNVYYLKTNAVTSLKTLWKRTLGETAENQVSGGEYSSIYVLDSVYNANGYNALVVDSTNSIYLLKDGNDNNRQLIGNYSTITGLGVKNGYFYFVSDKSICRVNIFATNPEKEVLTDSKKTYYVSTPSLIDFDGRRLFAFVEYDGKTEEDSEEANKNYYLNVIDLTKSEFKSRFVGIFADGECPEKPEECKHTDHLAEECPQAPWID